MDIKSINSQIAELTSLRNEYFKKKIEENKEELLCLDWLKDVHFIFREGISAHGGKEYVLSGHLPEKFNNVLGSNYITLRGNSRHYYNNVIMRKPYSECYNAFDIVTVNAKEFCAFINELKLKISLPFNFKDEVCVYNALASKAK